MRSLPPFPFPLPPAAFLRVDSFPLQRSEPGNERIEFFFLPLFPPFPCFDLLRGDRESCPLFLSSARLKKNGRLPPFSRSSLSDGFRISSPFLRRASHARLPPSFPPNRTPSRTNVLLILPLSRQSVAQEGTPLFSSSPFPPLNDAAQLEPRY